MNTKTFGARVKKLRRAKDVSVEQFAKKIDISVDHLRAVECGRRTPSLEVCVKIINALNISADELLKGSVTQASSLLINDITRKMIGLSNEELRMLDAVCSAMIDEFKNNRQQN